MGKSGHRRRAQKLSRHHMVPRSRCTPRMTDHHRNIKRIPRWVHQNWHTLWANMTPFEIVEVLICSIAPAGYFVSFAIDARWEGRRYQLSHSDSRRAKSRHRFSGSQKEAWKRLFGGRSHFDVVVYVVEQWAPVGYFQRVELSTASGDHSLVYTSPWEGANL